MVPRMSTPITPSGDDAVRATIAATFVPKHWDSPPTDTSQSVAPFKTQTENASAAVTARVMIARPEPDTTISVINDWITSLPGCARCSQTMRMPPMMTDNTANPPT